MDYYITIGITIVLLLVSNSYQAEIELRRYYNIENVDGTILTIGGDPIENTKVITTDDRKTTDLHAARQRFWIGSRIVVDRTTYEISPELQNQFSSLVLEQNQQSGLLYQQVRLLNRSQWWKIIDVGDLKWHIQNDQSGLCLASAGPGNQVVSQLCDASSTNQAWYFNIAKHAGITP